MDTWKTRHIEKVLSFGRYLTVERHEIELPDGRVINDWPWVITPDFICVLAVDEDGMALVFRQGKYGYDGDSLAPVGGFIEPGEHPLEAAKRELLEETGCEAAEWIHLGGYVTDPNRGMGRGDFYLARRARYLQPPDADDLEDQELLRLSAAELKDAVADGQFRVISWAACAALALMRIEKGT